MSFRSEAAAWGAALLYALPLIALFLLAQATSGWVSIVAVIVLFAAFLGLLAWGIWQDMHLWDDAEDADEESDPRA